MGALNPKTIDLTLKTIYLTPIDSCIMSTLWMPYGYWGTILFKLMKSYKLLRCFMNDMLLSSNVK